MNNLFRWLLPTRSSATKTMGKQDQQLEQKSIGNTNVVAFQNHLNAQWSSPDYRSLAQSGYMRNPIVHRCIRLIAETAASVPKLYMSDGKLITDSKAVKLLNSPNPRQSGKCFLETLYGHLLVSGNGFIHASLIDDVPEVLSTLRPDRVTIKADNQGWPAGYKYGHGHHGFYTAIDDEGKCPILHLSLFHPLDDHYGFYLYRRL